MAIVRHASKDACEKSSLALLCPSYLHSIWVGVDLSGLALCCQKSKTSIFLWWIHLRDITALTSSSGNMPELHRCSHNPPEGSAQYSGLDVKCALFCIQNKLRGTVQHHHIASEHGRLRARIGPSSRSRRTLSWVWLAPGKTSTAPHWLVHLGMSQKPLKGFPTRRRNLIDELRSSPFRPIADVMSRGEEELWTSRGGKQNSVGMSWRLAASMCLGRAAVQDLAQLLKVVFSFLRSLPACCSFLCMHV